MAEDKPARILRSTPLSNGDVVTLPVGIQKPGESQRYREIVIDEMRGVDEELAATKKMRRQPWAYVTTLLRRVVQEIPGLLEDKGNPEKKIAAEYVRDWMSQPDRDALLVAVIVLSGESESDMAVVCPKCGERDDTVPLRYDKFKVYDWPDTAPLVLSGTLPSGYRDPKTKETYRDFTLTIPNGKVQEMVLASAGGNEAKASSLLLASSLQLDGYGDIDQDIARNFKRRDRAYVADLIANSNPGVDMEVEVECSHCGEETKHPVDLTGFFQGASQ